MTFAEKEIVFFFMFYASPMKTYTRIFLWTIYPELESSWICQFLPADLAMKGEMVCSNIPTITK